MKLYSRRNGIFISAVQGKTIKKKAIVIINNQYTTPVTNFARREKPINISKNAHNLLESRHNQDGDNETTMNKVQILSWAKVIN